MRARELIERLRRFVEDLQKHRELYAKSLNRHIPDYPIRNQQELRIQQKELNKQLYVLDPYINIFTKGRIMHHPATGIEWDVYRSAVGNDTAQIKGHSLSNAILELEGIIAVLDEGPGKQEIRLDSETSPSKEGKLNLQAIQMFDSLNLHPNIVASSRSLFASRHYAQAIFEAFKAVNNYVKDKSGKTDLDGQKLMAQVFDENNPVIKLTPLITPSDKDEQKGFRFIYMGSMTGIRNPKAHDHIQQKDPVRALKYLALASLLIERAEEGQTGGGR